MASFAFVHCRFSRKYIEAEKRYGQASYILAGSEYIELLYSANSYRMGSSS